jgi:hypothetical protein
MTPKRTLAETTTEAVANVVGAHDKQRRRSRAERRDEARAKRWRHIPELERAIKLRDTDPAAYARLDATTKLSVGYYETDRAAAEAAGVDVTDDPEGGAA